MPTDSLDAQNVQPEQAQPEQAQPDIWPIIIAWGQGHQPSSAQRQSIASWELSDPDRARLWHLTATPFTPESDLPKSNLPESNPLNSNQQVTDALARRAALLQLVVQGIETHPETQSLAVAGPWTDWIEPLWTFWLPFSQWLDQQQRALKAPFIQGVLGGQGTGKTTLTKILTLILGHLGQRSIGFSIDDLYLTYAQRQVLQKQDPRFIWRGPPGTHDIELGLQTLTELKQATSASTVMLPQFDKSLHGGQGDRTTPLAVNAPTIVLFEGWFVGAQPVDEATFCADSPLPAPIVSPCDRQFAADCNGQLRRYLPLWDFLDSLIVLHPADYRLSQQWREQAERDMKAQGKGGMSDEDIAAFVTYFWKALHPELFITPLVNPTGVYASGQREAKMPTASANLTANLVVTIREDHGLGKLYQPDRPTTKLA